MFDFGKKYTLEFASFRNGNLETFVEENMLVVSADGNVVKFSRDGHDVIINAASPAFVKATLQYD